MYVCVLIKQMKSKNFLSKLCVFVFVCVCVWIRESFAEIISLTRRSILFGAGLVNKQLAAVASLATVLRLKSIIPTVNQLHCNRKAQGEDPFLMRLHCKHVLTANC